MHAVGACRLVAVSLLWCCTIVSGELQPPNGYAPLSNIHHRQRRMRQISDPSAQPSSPPYTPPLADPPTYPPPPGTAVPPPALVSTPPPATVTAPPPPANVTSPTPPTTTFTPPPPRSLSSPPPNVTGPPSPPPSLYSPPSANVTPPVVANYSPPAANHTPPPPPILLLTPPPPVNFSPPPLNSTPPPVIPLFDPPPSPVVQPPPPIVPLPPSAPPPPRFSPPLPTPVSGPPPPAAHPPPPPSPAPSNASVSTASKPLSTGAIVGIGVGGVAALAALGLFLYFAVGRGCAESNATSASKYAASSSTGNNPPRGPPPPPAPRNLNAFDYAAAAGASDLPVSLHKPAALLLPKGDADVAVHLLPTAAGVAGAGGGANYMSSSHSAGVAQPPSKDALSVSKHAAAFASQPNLNYSGGGATGYSGNADAMQGPGGAGLIAGAGGVAGAAGAAHRRTPSSQSAATDSSSKLQGSAAGAQAPLMGPMSPGARNGNAPGSATSTGTSTMLGPAPILAPAPHSLPPPPYAQRKGPAAASQGQLPNLVSPSAAPQTFMIGSGIAPTPHGLQGRSPAGGGPMLGASAGGLMQAGSINQHGSAGMGSGGAGSAGASWQRAGASAGLTGAAGGVAISATGSGSGTLSAVPSGVPVSPGPYEEPQSPAPDETGVYMRRMLTSLRVPYHTIQFGETLGRGSFGTVYKAVWRGNPVAVKMLNLDKLGSGAQDALRQEALVMCELRHPAIAPVYGLVDDGERCALVMKYYRRGTVAALINSPNYLERDLVTRLRMAQQVANGMWCLHERPMAPVLHGDLKTSNLLVDDDGVGVAIADFGLACSLRPGQIGRVVASGALTVTISPPEVLLEPTAPRTAAGDVYAFGIVLLEIISGRLAYRGMNASQIAHAVVDGKRPSIPETVPFDIAGVIDACWSQDRNDRPTFSDVVDALSICLDRHGAQAAADPSVTNTTTTTGTWYPGGHH